MFLTPNYFWKLDISAAKKKITTTKKQQQIKVCWSVNGESVYSALTVGGVGRPQDRRKKKKGRKNRASNVFSQPTKECKAPSFLIKTEGLGWMSVEFHSRQLKSHDTVRISSILQYRLKLSVPLLLSAHCQP